MAGTKTLTDVRAIVRSSLHVGVQAYSDTEVDRAVKAAFNQAIRETSITRTSGTVTLTAESATVDVSSLTLFRPERIVRAQITYSDQGTWTTSTSYAVNDYVVGDGTPDAKNYRAHTAHTSAAANEPGSGGTDVWTQVNWLGGFEIELVDYSNMAWLLDGQAEPRASQKATVETGPGTESGRPNRMAFKDSDTAYCWPVPDIAYPLEIQYQQALETWTDGASGASVTFASIEDEFVHELAYWGPIVFLSYSDTQSAHWKRAKSEWQNLLDRLRGHVNYNPGVLQKTPSDYE